jgi:hypothetical protein
LNLLVVVRLMYMMAAFAHLVYTLPSLATAKFFVLGNEESSERDRMFINRKSGLELRCKINLTAIMPGAERKLKVVQKLSKG